MSAQVISEEMGVHLKWYEEAREVTVETLGEFVKRLVEGYEHDYGTICHAMAAGALATLWAMDKTEQGGITGFQAGAIMWLFLKRWMFQGNKTGLRIVDYDDFLYPQYADKFDKTVPRSVWEALRKEARRRIEEADAEHEKWQEEMAQWEEEMEEFVKRHPDYLERPEYYEHLVCGTSEEWEEYERKKEEGFEFAPRKPVEPLRPGHPVYDHWVSIVKGEVPFCYRVVEGE